MSLKFYAQAVKMIIPVLSRGTGVGEVGEVRLHAALHQRGRVEDESAMLRAAKHVGQPTS